jgi:hypothetical protein
MPSFYFQPPMHTMEMEGFLVKRGLRIKTWKRRFFIFRNGVLQYKKDDRRTTKVIKSDIILDVCYWSRVKHGLCVRMLSGRGLYIRADSEEQADLWYDVFERYILHQQKGRDFHKLHCKQQLDPIYEAVSEC